MAIKNDPLQCKLTDFGKSTDAVARRCSVKKALLKISQNSQENTCAVGLQPAFYEKETAAQVFSCDL